MASKVNCKGSETQKVSMWINNHVNTYELYGRGNTNVKADVEKFLQQYSDKFKWQSKPRVLDVGSGDGSVTKMLFEYIPNDSELIGADINVNVVEYANQTYGNDRLKFIPFDVLAEVPDDMKGKFDHVFSLYVFHWIKDHRTAFVNIYKMLSKGGEFYAIFLARSDIYFIFKIISKRNKWAQWLENVEQFVSPYHDFQDPDDHLSNALNKVGFEVVDVTCKQRYFIHDTIEDFKSLMTGINCFGIPEHMWPDFLDDIVEVKRYMNLVDDNDAVKTNYNLMILHCTK